MVSERARLTPVQAKLTKALEELRAGVEATRRLLLERRQGHLRDPPLARSNEQIAQHHGLRGLQLDIPC